MDTQLPGIHMADYLSIDPFKYKTDFIFSLQRSSLDPMAPCGAL